MMSFCSSKSTIVTNIYIHLKWFYHRYIIYLLAKEWCKQFFIWLFCLYLTFSLLQTYYYVQNIYTTHCLYIILLLLYILIFSYTNEWTVLNFYISMIYPLQKKWLGIDCFYWTILDEKKNILFAYQTSLENILGF